MQPGPLHVYSKQEMQSHPSEVCRIQCELTGIAVSSNGHDYVRPNEHMHSHNIHTHFAASGR